VGEAIGRDVSPDTGGCASCGNHAGEAIETDLRSEQLTLGDGNKATKENFNKGES